MKNKNELPTIAYGSRPKILILGNGINRTFGTANWGDLLSKMSCGSFSDSEEQALSNMPYPLQAVVTSADCVDKGIELFSESLCNDEVDIKQKDIIKKLASCCYDAILTTNYTYEIEKSIDENFSAPYKKKSSFRKTTMNGNTKDDNFGLFKYMDIMYEGRKVPVWHIHGEAARPKSMILGHYYYGILLSRLQLHVQNVIRRYVGCNNYERDFIPMSWVDYFLISDIHIVGFGLDFSEMDLWWLINCKKLHADKLGNGSVTWYEPNLNTERFCAKKILANTYGVKVVTEEVGNGGYVEYYKRLVDSGRQ